MLLLFLKSNREIVESDNNDSDCLMEKYDNNYDYTYAYLYTYIIQTCLCTMFILFFLWKQFIDKF